MYVMYIVYVCSVLTSSIITSLENVSCIFFLTMFISHLNIVSYPLMQDDCHLFGLLCFIFSFFFFVDGVPMLVFATWINK